ncbi:MAG TPA: LPS export ABC transporter permease LptF [Candidatus Angelobacter sp.]|nr:LPS export ABC transporter permease LptF [Candidatus Angelobacter sp.]
MRIFTRYILKEVLSHGLIGASVFTFVIFMRLVSRILELVVRNSAPVPSVAELFFLTLPTALTITIPMGVLVGILLGLSRMAADSEVTAMRACGVSVRKFLKIVSIFGFSAWLLALVNTVVLAPRSNAALARLEKNLESSQISYEIQPRVFYENFKDVVVYVDDVISSSKSATWKNVFLADFRGGTLKITMAREAIVVSGGEGAIRLHMIDGEMHESDPRTPPQYSISTFHEQDATLSLNRPSLAKPTQETAPVAQMSSAELLRQSRGSKPQFARWYWIEFNRRLALPSACLVLVLIGIPLGLSARKGGKGAGFVLTIVLVFIYYFLSIIGVSLARSGKLSPVLGVWMANIIFALVGLWLLWRTDRTPIEIGMGQLLFLQLKNWSQAWMKEREDVAVRSTRPRLFPTRLAWVLVVPLALAIVILVFFGPRWLGKVPSSTWGGEYFYPLLLLFVLGMMVLFAQRFMLILDNYILKRFVSLLLLILASFLVLTLVFTFFELLSDIIRNKISPLTVGAYLLNEIPPMLYLVTPLSVLLAVLVAFGLLQKTNEITAMKATGVSIYRTLIPILGIAAALAGGLFLLDQWYLPYANKRVETLRNSIKGKPPQTYLRPSKWIFGQNNPAAAEDDLRRIYYYEVYEPERNEFGGFSSFELNPHSFAVTERVYAARAHWEENLQKWVLEKGWQRTFDGDTVRDFRQFEVSTFPEINEPPSYFKKEVRQYSEMNYDELRNYIRDLQQSGFDVVRLRVQLQKKIAFPLITLVMAVLALPFALSAGRRGALTGVAVALLITVGYYVTAGLFEAMGNVSQLPPFVAAWMPDVIFGLAGGYLILKAPS